jgi:hypothetical protein
MSTPAVIAIRQEDKTFLAICCQSDGYPEPGGVGGILNKHYRDAEKVQALIALGDISSLAAELSRVISYSRDRGEPFEENKPLMFSSRAELVRAKSHIYAACYVYIYDNGTWSVYQGSRWKALSDVLDRYTKKKQV